jgi:single-stranded-DNA-specific exonuclease
VNKYIWHQDGGVDPDIVRELAVSLDIPTAGARFLASRSLDIATVQTYLHTDGSIVHDPFLFDDMARAVERIGEAVAKKKRILIHGDYDVDGICGTAVLYRYLHGIVPHVFRFLPDRRTDGYGIAKRAADWAVDNNVGLFIGVDCGTSDGDIIGHMESAGIDVIVCDHHEFPVEREARGIVLNPARESDHYPFRGLCGTGVAFKLILALEQRGVSGAVSAWSLLDLVAMATVGDVSPLVDENRYFVREGLALAGTKPRPGLAALAATAKLQRQELTAFHVGYILAPRLNAPGRLSNPKPALELLCTDDAVRAAELAAVLEAENDRRKSLTERVKREAMERIRAMLVSLEGGVGKGSGRSIPGVNLKEHLDRCSGYLLRHGGHAQAVGFSIDPSKLGAFVRQFSVQLDQATATLPKKPRLHIDTEISFDECSLELIDFLSSCEPFGQGNPAPVWIIKDVVIRPETRRVGNGHLKFFFRDSRGMDAEGICFNWLQRETRPESLHGLVMDLAVSIRRGYYLEKYYPEIHVIDVRLSGG